MVSRRDDQEQTDHREDEAKRGISSAAQPDYPIVYGAARMELLTEIRFVGAVKQRRGYAQYDQANEHDQRHTARCFEQPRRPVLGGGVRAFPRRSQASIETGGANR